MKLCIFIICFGFSFISKSQVFWTETFGGSACSSGLSAIGFNSGNGAWAVTNTGVNNSSANAWFVSAKERGMGVGVCGAGCGGTNNRTLHLGSTGLFLDLGAAYNETNSGNITDKRAESPTINCSGRSSITLSFSYMEFGQGTADNATLWYFNGTVWALLIDIPKTLCCSNTVCNGFNQGLWVNYTIVLPASADNNPNVKIGFRWVNNGNGVGTDPSVAIDDISLSTTVLPIELTDFSYSIESNGVKLMWETAGEKNSDHFEIERSTDAAAFYTIGEIKSAGESYGYKQYSFIDPVKPEVVTYYRLKMVDKDATYKYSHLIVVDTDNSGPLSEPAFYNSNTGNIEVRTQYVLSNGITSLSVYNMEGKLILQNDIKNNADKRGSYQFAFRDQSQGIYFCVLKNYSGQKTHKIFIP
jgi:hypothetical protein